MKTFAALIIILGANVSLGIQKSSFETETQEYSSWGGAPWAEGTSHGHIENVVGPCIDQGLVLSEAQCIDLAQKDGLDFYQVTNGNYSKAYHGALWDYSAGNYMKCFTCAATAADLQKRRDQVQQEIEQLQEQERQNELRAAKWRAQINAQNAQSWMEKVISSNDANVICEYVTRANSGYSEECYDSIGKTKLSTTGIPVAMAAALKNLGYLVEVINALGNKDYSPEMQQLFVNIIFANPGYAVEAIQAAGQKTFSEAEMRRCKIASESSLSLAVSCLKKTGKNPK